MDRWLNKSFSIGRVAGLYFAVMVCVSPATGQTPDNAQLERAVGAYEDGRIQAARSSLDSVYVDLLTDRDASIYHLYSGFVDLVFGQEQAARQHFRASVRLDSDVQPDPSLVAPGRLAIYREERQAEQRAGQRLVALRIDPESATLRPGDSIHFAVSGRRGDGSQVRSPQVSLRVVPASAGRVEPEGWFIPARSSQGSSMHVVAQAEDVADTAQVAVAVPVAARIERLHLEPQQVRLTVGDTVTPRLEVFDADGTRIDGVNVSWASNDRSIATVSEGAVVARSPGSTTIEANAGDHTTQMGLSVRPAVAGVRVSPNELSLETGGQSHLNGVAVDKEGGRLEGIVLRWESRDTTVVTVEADGTIRGQSPGTTTVLAMAGDVVRQVPVEVSSGRVAGGAAFAAGLVIPGLGNYMRDQPEIGVPVTLIAVGAAAIGMLSTRTEEWCAVPATDNCPPGETVRTEDEKHMLVPGLAVAGGTAIVGAIIAAVGGNETGTPEEEHQASISVARNLRLTVRPISRAGRLNVTLISWDPTGSDR